MCAVLGMIALGLQGCEEKLAEMKAQIANAAASAGTSAAGQVLQQYGGCPPFIAAWDTSKVEALEKMTAGVQALEACKDNLKGETCKNEIAFTCADIALFTIEEDPGFKTWTTEHETKWSGIKSTLDGALKHNLKAPVQVMQDSWVNGTDITTVEFKDTITPEIDTMIDVSLRAFCPADEAEVEAAESADAPAVEAKEEAEEAAAIANEEHVREENAAEGVTARRLVSAGPIDDQFQV